MLRKIAFTVCGLLLFAALVLFGWYQVDGQPLPETEQFLVDAAFDFVEEADGALLFTPRAHAGRGNGHGLVIMHGALIKPRSYAKTAAHFATAGYTVYLPSGPARLSIGAVAGAAERMAKIPVTGWFSIGHSMGGLSSMMLINDYDIDIRAAALWATAMPADFKDADLPIKFIRGTNDGLLTPKRFIEAQQNLPPGTDYVTLDGANHRDFAMYSHQFFDHDGTLGWSRQIATANELTEQFFAQYL
jgi:alpha-beta hydrolase superfamily lysophospholipase